MEFIINVIHRLCGLTQGRPRVISSNGLAGYFDVGILANQVDESQSVPKTSPLQYFTESAVKQLFSVLVATQLGDWASRPACSISRSESNENYIEVDSYKDG